MSKPTVNRRRFIACGTSAVVAGPIALGSSMRVAFAQDQVDVNDPTAQALAYVHDGSTSDKRTDALLPKELLNDPIMYPAADLLEPLEFGAASTLTSPARAELLARFKAA